MTTRTVTSLVDADANPTGSVVFRGITIDATGAASYYDQGTFCAVDNTGTITAVLTTTDTAGGPTVYEVRMDLRNHPTITYYAYIPSGGGALDLVNAPRYSGIPTVVHVPASFGTDTQDAEVSADIAVHAAVSTAVHGIADTSALALTANVVAKGSLFFNVKDYGAKGDGVTDDSAAFVAAQAAAYATRVLNTTVTNGAADRIIQASIYIPPGVYLITASEALIPSTQTQRTRGLRFFGASQYASSIVFSPTTGTKCLINNNDCFQFMVFQDITFVSTVAAASFMLSYSAGGPQSIYFDRCVWDGTWTYGADLTGTNTNSEMTWRDCSIYGNWNTFLHVGAVGTSDQFVDYNFYNPNVAMVTGNLIDMYYGGNINMWGGNLIHLGDGSVPQSFFNLRGATHGYGVQRLSVIGVRTEHRHPLSELIYCEWANGTVSFVSCDTGSQSGNTGAATQTIAQFSSSSVSMPTVEFVGCSLMGQHNYTDSVNSWDYAHRVDYKSCVLMNASDADSFITFTDTAGNPGGRPVIQFENCYSQAGTHTSQRLVDCSFGWNTNNYGLPKRRAVSLKTPAGTSPSTVYGPQVVQLPQNSIITRIFAVKDSGGGSTSTTWTYTFTDANSATVATISAGGTTWNTAWNKDSGSLYYRCSTSNKRTITCTPANITEDTALLDIVVEYLA